MTLVFISNFINHHQVYVADEFYKLLGVNYKFIETEPIPESFIKNGYPIFDRPYLVKAYKGKSYFDLAKSLAFESDVAIIGSAPEIYVTNRIKSGKLTFRCHERWFKTRPWFLTSPRGWFNIYRYHLRYISKPLYMLCASAFTAKDVNTVGAYRNKCFKWGYLTKVDCYPEMETLNQHLSNSEHTIRIMWCARFIKWKHPELPVKLAVRLKAKGYNFVINMFGSGVELENTKLLAKSLNVEDCVHFLGNRPNEEILSEMRKHQIFLFTSDRNEGWGAVLNEALSSGCAVVCSDEIGAVPFLIKDGVNGSIFKAGNLKSLEGKVVYLFENRDEIGRFSIEAYKTMKYEWCPSKAARSFLTLVDAIMSNNLSIIPFSGPCSRA